LPGTDILSVLAVSSEKRILIRIDIRVEFHGRFPVFVNINPYAAFF